MLGIAWDAEADTFSLKKAKCERNATNEANNIEDNGVSVRPVGLGFTTASAGENIATKAMEAEPTVG